MTENLFVVSYFSEINKITYLLTYLRTYLLTITGYLLTITGYTDIEKKSEALWSSADGLQTFRYCENSEALEHSTNGIQSFNINTLTSVKKTFEKTKKISPNTKTVFLSIIFRKDR